jgi:hypothetical protein
MSRQPVSVLRRGNQVEGLFVGPNGRTLEIGEELLPRRQLFRRWVGDCGSGRGWFRRRSGALGPTGSGPGYGWLGRGALSEYWCRLREEGHFLRSRRPGGCQPARGHRPIPPLRGRVNR